MSLPTRGAWIEIILVWMCALFRRSRPPRGAGVVIALNLSKYIYETCRSPPGGRGLKFLMGNFIPMLTGSLPTRGAWIEIVPV